jgi:hypothetical protein
MIDSEIIIDGMFDDPSVMLLDGIEGYEVGETEETQREEFHYLPATPRSFVELDLEAEVGAGETIDIRKRGVGQFGVFRKATSDFTDWRLRVYSNNDKTQLLAEFTG